jgi:hypothetical protein
MWTSANEIGCWWRFKTYGSIESSTGWSVLSPRPSCWRPSLSPTWSWNMTMSKPKMKKWAMFPCHVRLSEWMFQNFENQPLKPIDKLLIHVGFGVSVWEDPVGFSTSCGKALKNLNRVHCWFLTIHSWTYLGCVILWGLPHCGVQNIGRLMPLEVAPSPSNDARGGTLW